MKQHLIRAWQQTWEFFKTTSSRLALSYLAIIMLMSIGFSIVFYNTSSHELSRQIPPPSTFMSFNGESGQVNTEDQIFTGPLSNRRDEYQQFFKDRIDEGRRSLLQHLIVINIVILAAGAILSYYLARRTLQPIEENMEAQAQFVSDASHELRTPLTAMQTSHEVALRRSKITDPQARQIISDNIKDIVRLRTLTDGLLRLARQDVAHVKLVPVLLSDAVGEAINTSITAASAKHITIEDKVGTLRGLADSYMLPQIVAILLDNAVKYSPDKSVVTVSAEAKGRHVLLHVTDKGMGIAEADIPHIFDRFYRASAARTITTRDGEASGYGLGLSIAQKLVHQLGGELSVASKAGKGSVFTIRLSQN